MPKIGVHVAKISKVLNSPNRKDMLQSIISDTKELNIKSCQIFTHGPANSNTNKMDYNAIKTYCDSNDINLYVHSAYITTGIWNVNKTNHKEKKSLYIINLVVNHFIAADLLGAKGLIIHTPKKEPEKIAETIKLLISYIKKYKTPLILEMTAIKPDPLKTYETPQKINRLNDLLISKCAYTNWGWCIDTAHLWGAGIEVDNMQIMENWFDELKHPDKILLFHLNGSSIDTYDTGKDNHKPVFASDDDIWNQDAHIDDGLDMKKIKKSSLSIIAKFAKKYNIDCICEINRGSYQEIKFSIESLLRIFK